MFFGSAQKKLAVAICSGAIALGASYGAVPAPQAAAAGWGNIAGAVIGGAITSVQVNNYIKKYDKSEEGRAEFFASLKAKLGVNNDVELNSMLDRVMGNLTKGIGSIDSTIYDKPYNYFINNDTSFNAFCTLGHNMSVNTGAFSMLSNEDELAVILAHEMGHGQKEHPAKGAKRSIAPQILADATGGIAGVLVANLWNNQGITKPMEWEADNMAFEYITHTSYNPGATAAVWQRIMEKSKSSPNAFLQFLSGGSDHPSDKSRRDNYIKKLTEYSRNKVTMEEGTLKVNGKDFVTPAAAGNMSSAERACFVMGNLAAAFHNNQSAYPVKAVGNVVRMGDQDIIECLPGDESAQELATRLEALR